MDRLITLTPYKPMYEQEIRAYLVDKAVQTMVDTIREKCPNGLTELTEQQLRLSVAEILRNGIVRNTPVDPDDEEL